jgi:gamma-glutamylcyclotransferase (GGCT)/AIG2-like uncharacterized protein YtfP
MENLFAYGTLKDLNIQQKLFNRVLTGNKAALSNYKKSSILIDGELFPCIDEVKDYKVEGIIFKITSEELAITDEYEGKEYKRIAVLPDNNLEKVWVYIRA